MKLINAYAKNFGPYENIDLDFDNIHGLTMLEGSNLDDGSSSGSGKTFIMDLISFVPFGESPRGLKVNEFVNDNSTKGCLAGLKFRRDDGSILKIERSRKPEDLHYSIDNNNPVRGGNVRETQTMVEELLKLDFNTFVNSVYFTQNANMKFISASDTEKRDILTRILDLSDFDKAYETADLQIKEVNKGVETIKNELTKIESMKAMAQKDLEGLKTSATKFKSDIADQLTSKAMQNSQLNRKVQDAKLMIEVLEKKDFTPPEFDMTQPDISGFDTQQEKLRNTKFEDISEDIAKPDNSDLDASAVELIKKVSVKTKLEAKIKEVEKERTEINFELEAVKKTIKTIRETGEGKCPKCFQFVSKQHLEQEEADLVATRDSLLDKYTAINLQKFTDALDKVKEAEHELAKIEIEKNNREKAYSAAIKALADKQKAQAAEKLAIEKQIAQIEQSKQNVLREYGMAEKIHAEKIKQVEIERADNANRIQAQHDSIASLIEQMHQIQIEMMSLDKKENPFFTAIDKKEDDIALFDVQLSKLNEKMAELNDEIEVLTILKASYKNVKYYIFESTIDELNSRINKYLEPLFNEDVKVTYEYISGKNNDKLKFETKIIKNGINKSFESLSDGEKKRAELATNFALSDIVSMRKANSFSLMLLDECFSGLPSECIERVVSLLEILKLEKEQILIIDHFQATKDLVENTIRVEKKDGISRVVNA